MSSILESLRAQVRGHLGRGESPAAIARLMDLTRVGPDGYFNPVGDYVRLPGWFVQCIDVGSDHEPEYVPEPDGPVAALYAAEQVVAAWGQATNETQWVRVSVWREAYGLAPGQYKLGDFDEIRTDEEWLRITIDPEIPPCVEDAHDFVDYIRVRGRHGEGVTYTERCRHCGLLCENDTGATCPETGMQGLHRQRYRPWDGNWCNPQIEVDEVEADDVDLMAWNDVTVSLDGVPHTACAFVKRDGDEIDVSFGDDLTMWAGDVLVLRVEHNEGLIGRVQSAIRKALTSAARMTR